MDNINDIELLTPAAKIWYIGLNGYQRVDLYKKVKAQYKPSKAFWPRNDSIKWLRRCIAYIENNPAEFAHLKVVA